MGGWLNFDHLEDELCLDELFLLYETVTEKQKRQMQMFGAAMGAGTESKTPVSSPIIGQDGSTLFGYSNAE